MLATQEYQLDCIKDELKQLLVFESESKRKDEVIATLRKEIVEYKKCTQSRDVRYNSSITWYRYTYYNSCAGQGMLL